MIMENWFRITRIDENTFAISEPNHWEETNCYLLIGEKRSILIDTGLGIGNIFKEVCKLSSKPVVAIPTHVHWDHIGGLWNFPEFYVHEAENEWISGKFPLSNDFVKKQLVKENNLTELIKTDDYAVFQGKPSGVLNNGDIIDIGGRIIKVLHTPGHSPGHMCFYEEESGYLFTGDLIYKGTLFANYDSTCPEEYFESVKKIAELSAKRIFPAHHSIEISTGIIFEVLNGLTEIKNQGKLCHGSGIFSFEEWSILL